MLARLNHVTASPVELRTGKGLVSGIVPLSLCHAVVAPDSHHWHHSQGAEAIDRGYAAPFAFIGHLVGTVLPCLRERPAHCSVQSDYMPDGFWAQVKFPFARRT